MLVRRALRLFAAVIAAFAFSSRAHAAAKIQKFSGKVTLTREGQQIDPRPLPFELAAGDVLSTSKDSTAELVFGPQARSVIQPLTQFAYLEPESGKMTLSLLAGRLKAWVQGDQRKEIKIRTPSAVAAIRGTEFDVAHDGDTLIEVYDGLIAVSDLLGNEALVASGERLRVVPGRPLDRPERMEGRIFMDPKTEIKREVALGMSKDAVQSAAALEARLAEYQEGKTLIDVNGARVRLEEYVVRPAADQFKLVVLNERDARFDYFYYHGTFNAALPTDLSAALKDLGGKTGATPPAYWLISAESGRSNTTDTILENWTGGKPVNGTLANDKVVYHPDTDSFETILSGTTLWENIFDNYSYKVNGTEYFGWEPNSLVTSVNAYNYDNFRTRVAGTKLGRGTGVDVSCATDAACVALENQFRPSTLTQANAGALHDTVSIEYKANNGGTPGAVVYSETYDFYVANDLGNIASINDFSGALSGQSYLETLLQFNFQQIIQSSAFSGRKIDLVVEPKILIRSGLLE